MATLVIKDLTEDKALDERAMKAVSGGNAGYRLARSRPLAGAILATPGSLEESRLVRGLYKTSFLPR
jgi:hypothetical protein